MTALLHLEVPLPRLTLRLHTAWRETRSEYDFSVLSDQNSTYLNFGNQNNPYHSRVWKYLMLWVKIIIENNFRKLFYFFLANFVLLHSRSLWPESLSSYLIKISLWYQKNQKRKCGWSVQICHLWLKKHLKFMYVNQMHHLHT